MKVLMLLRDSAIVVGSFVLGFAVLGSILYGTWKRTPSPRRIAEWAPVAAGENRAGRADAPITIVEFSDFQCPFCRVESGTLAEVVEDYGGEVAVVFRHFPILSVHPFAERAAIAAECAGRQGRFFPYHTALFAEQDAIGTAPWTRFATQAGVPDTAIFAACVSSQAPIAGVRADVALGERLAVKGTPTLYINGYELTGTPSRATIDSAIKVLQRAAKRPGDE